MKKLIILAMLLSACAQNTAKPTTLVGINKEHQNLKGFNESTPFVLNDRLYLFFTDRGNYFADASLSIEDDQGNVEVVATGYTLGCAFVENNEVLIFGSNLTTIAMFQKVNGLWVKTTIIEADGNEYFYNSSVAKTDNGYIIAYETDMGTDTRGIFTFKYAKSNDLINWTKVNGLVFNKNKYTACPTIRQYNGTYYVSYLVHEDGIFFTVLSRSTDLKNWERAQATLLAPDLDEGNNASDMDYVEFNGQVIIYYIDGDQQSWGSLRRATYNGTLEQMFKSAFIGNN